MWSCNLEMSKLDPPQVVCDQVASLVQCWVVSRPKKHQHLVRSSNLHFTGGPFCNLSRNHQRIFNSSCRWGTDMMRYRNDRLIAIRIRRGVLSSSSCHQPLLFQRKTSVRSPRSSEDKERGAFFKRLLATLAADPCFQNVKHL